MPMRYVACVRDADLATAYWYRAEDWAFLGGLHPMVVRGAKEVVEYHRDLVYPK